MLDAFERRFGVTILEGYGLSETASTTTFNRSVDDRRIYSVGQADLGDRVPDLGRARRSAAAAGASTSARSSPAASTR